MSKKSAKNKDPVSALDEKERNSKNCVATQDINQQLIQQTTQNANNLLKEISLRFMQFAQMSTGDQPMCLDQKKILKLFSYNKWEEYMKWIEEKLAESSESESQSEVQQPVTNLSEIVEQEAEMEDSRNQHPNRSNSNAESTNNLNEELKSQQQQQSVLNNTKAEKCLPAGERSVSQSSSSNGLNKENRVHSKKQSQQNSHQSFQNYSSDTVISCEKSASELMAIENAKLRKENIGLQKKIKELTCFYYNTQGIEGISRSVIRKNT